MPFLLYTEGFVPRVRIVFVELIVFCVDDVDGEVVACESFCDTGESESILLFDLEFFLRCDLVVDIGEPDNNVTMVIRIRVNSFDLIVMQLILVIDAEVQVQGAMAAKVIDQVCFFKCCCKLVLIGVIDVGEDSLWVFFEEVLPGEGQRNWKAWGVGMEFEVIVGLYVDVVNGLGVNGEGMGKSMEIDGVGVDEFESAGCFEFMIDVGNADDNVMVMCGCFDSLEGVIDRFMERRDDEDCARRRWGFCARRC